jgi:hypothetical protein
MYMQVGPVGAVDCQICMRYYGLAWHLSFKQNTDTYKSRICRRESWPLFCIKWTDTFHGKKGHWEDILVLIVAWRNASCHQIDGISFLLQFWFGLLVLQFVAFLGLVSLR